MKEIISKTLGYDLYLLNSDFSNFKYELIYSHVRHVYIVIRDLELTKNLYAHGVHDRLRHAAVVTAATTAVAATAATETAKVAAQLAALVSDSDDDYQKVWKSYGEKHNQAKKEFEETGKFEGYEIYCVTIDKKLWISKADWNLLLHLPDCQ